MAASTIAITEGSGKLARTNSRILDGTNTVEEYYFHKAEPAIATFEVVATAIATTTSASHLLFIQADGTLYTRIKRIYVVQVAAATAATLAQLQVIRTSTAGSGGGAITARGRDAADSYTGTIQTLPTVKGTEGNTLLNQRLALSNVAATTSNPNSWEWLAREDEGQKPIVIGPSATDGICIKIVTGIAGATVDLNVTFCTDAAL